MPPTVAAAPPFALATPSFRFRAVAALVSRAPIGPSREVALAWFVCVRLLDSAIGAARLAGPVRSARAAAAKTWLAGAGVPASCRIPFARLVDACGSEGEPDAGAIAAAASDLLKATGDQLDPASRNEIDALLVR